MSIQQLTESAGVTEADLDEPVSEANLYDLAKFIEKDWRDIVPHLRVSDQADGPIQVLKKWRENAQAKATYRALVEVYLSLKKTSRAEQVFKLLKR